MSHNNSKDFKLVVNKMQQNLKQKKEHDKEQKKQHEIKWKNIKKNKEILDHKKLKNSFFDDIAHISDICADFFDKVSVIAKKLVTDHGNSIIYGKELLYSNDTMKFIIFADNISVDFSNKLVKLYIYIDNLYSTISHSHSLLTSNDIDELIITLREATQITEITSEVKINRDRLNLELQKIDDKKYNFIGYLLKYQPGKRTICADCSNLYNDSDDYDDYYDYYDSDNYDDSSCSYL